MASSGPASKIEHPLCGSPGLGEVTTLVGVSRYLPSAGESPATASASLPGVDAGVVVPVGAVEDPSDAEAERPPDSFRVRHPVARR